MNTTFLACDSRANLGKDRQGFQQASAYELITRPFNRRVLDLSIPKSAVLSSPVMGEQAGLRRDFLTHETQVEGSNH